MARQRIPLPLSQPLASCPTPLPMHLPIPQIASCCLVLPDCSNGQPGLLLVARQVPSSSSSAVSLATAAAATCHHHHLASAAVPNIPASLAGAAPLPSPSYFPPLLERLPAQAAAKEDAAVSVARPTSVPAVAAAADAAVQVAQSTYVPSSAADSVSWRTASTSSAHPTAIPGGSIRHPPSRNQSASVRRLMSRQRLYGKGVAAGSSSGTGDRGDVLQSQAVCSVVSGIVSDLVPAAVMVFACNRWVGVGACQTHLQLYPPSIYELCITVTHPKRR